MKIVNIEEGKNPGLGLRILHKKGLTGKNVNVAVIDQKLRLTHEEYKKRIIDYVELYPVNESFSMHGSAVSSFLCGKNCGVAPDVSLHYYATKAGRSFIDISQSLRKIIEFNAYKSIENQIRVISISIGYRDDADEPGLKEFKEATEIAFKSGIFLFYVNNQFVPFAGGGSNTNKDDFRTYKPALFLEDSLNNTAIIVPTDYRTRASHLDNTSYTYMEKGGMSWAMPYLAGVAALALQKRSNLTFLSFIESVKKSVNHTDQGIGIINPEGILESF